MENSQLITGIEEKLKLILFISGMSPKSSHAIQNLKKICTEYLEDNFDLDIVDIGQEIQMALDYQIIAIPTLIKINPTPSRIILGDLSDTEKVLRILDINT